MTIANLSAEDSAKLSLLEDVLDIVREMREEARQRESRSNVRSWFFAAVGLAGGYLLNAFDLGGAAHEDAVIDVGRHIFWAVIVLSSLLCAYLVFLLNRSGLDSSVRTTHRIETASKPADRAEEACRSLEQDLIKIGPLRAYEASVVDRARRIIKEYVERRRRGSKDWESMIVEAFEERRS